MSTVEKSIRLYAWKTNYKTFQVVQGESNSRKFSIQLFSTTLPVSLVGCEVMFFAVKPDSTKVYVECEILDVENGLISVTLTEQMCVVDGTVDCWVQVIGNGGTDLRFEGMNIEVSSCPMTKSIESADEMKAFLQQISRLTAVEQEVQNARAGETDLLAKQTAQDAALAQTAAIVRQEMHSADSTLQQNIQVQKARIDDITTHIMNSYITPEMFGAIGDGEHDDTEALREAIRQANVYRKEIVLKRGSNYKITESINVTGTSWVTIIGYSSSIYMECDTLFNVYGSSRFRVYGVNIQCNGGTAFNYADDHEGHSRSTNTLLEDVIMTGHGVGVKIDCPSGYNYINRCRFTEGSEGGCAIRIGKEYDSSSVSPNYIYIEKCQIEGNFDDVLKNGIEIYNVNFLYIDNNDICNFTSGNGIFINPYERFIYQVRITENSIFNNKTGICIGGTVDGNAINYISLSGNQYLLKSGEIGIHKTSVSRQINRMSVIGEVFITLNNEIPDKIVALNKITTLVFDGCIPPEVPRVPDYVEFNNITYFDRKNLVSNCYTYFDVNAQSTKEYVVGSPNDWFSVVTPIIIPTDVGFTDYTVVRTVNDNGTVTMKVTNNSTSKRRFVVR